MMNANHAIAPATESSVSPWRNEAWARDGSARNVKAMNRTKRLPRDRQDFAYERMSEFFGFMVYQLPISALYIFNHIFVQNMRARVVTARPPLRCAVLLQGIVVLRGE